MHGFYKLHKRPKKELLEALSTTKLLNLQRSTLDALICPCGSWPTVDAVNDDLDALGWRECPVQSVQTLNRTAEDHHLHHHRSRTKGRVMPTAFEVTGKRARSKRRRSVNVNANMDKDDDGAAFDDAGVHLDVDSLLHQLSSAPLA